MSTTNNFKPPLPITHYQPAKAIYLSARLLALLVLVPSWLAYYTVAKRPRPTWTLKQSVIVRIIRWVMPLNALCGITPLRTDKARAVPQSELKETTFVWLEPADPALLVGEALDDKIQPIRIPGYVWPKGGELGEDGGLVGLFIHGGGYMMGNGQETYPETSERVNASAINS